MNIQIKMIKEQISILEKSIKGMLNLKDLVPFELDKAKEYVSKINILFTNLVSKEYFKIETSDLDVLCKDGLDKWDKINYFLKPEKNSTFQQVFYSIKPEKTALILGCSLYLMIFEDFLYQFDKNTIIRIFEDLKNKKDINISNQISAYAKIEILKRFLERFDKTNSEFFNELDRELRNSIAHFDFHIKNNQLIYNNESINKQQLKIKTEKIFWLGHIILLTKDLVIRKHLLKDLK